VIYPAEMLLTFFQLQEINYAKPSVKPDYTIVLIVLGIAVLGLASGLIIFHVRVRRLSSVSVQPKE